MSMRPVADSAAARVLGDALRRLDYTEEAIFRLLGDDAYSGDGEVAVVGERRLPRTRLGTVVRAFFLQLPISRRDAVRALGRAGVEALEATDLAEVGNDVVPRVRILPVGSLLVASDDYPPDDREEPADYVAAYTPTSQLLDALTPRPRVARALDVGTGSGVQALLAARHARHVVATDVNPRALVYTQLNAALNGFTNIECRTGSMFEPVGGETFDLITCNAPYVVSPENRWAFRDGGLEADEFSERVVQGAADHLVQAGFATLLVSWIADDEDEPDEHPLTWTEGTGCDSWILPVWGADALAHAATWNEHLTDDPEQLGEALDAWTSYLARLGVRWVSEGAVVLHRRPGHRYTARVDSVEEDELDTAGDQIQRAFDSRARLSELRRNSELLEARLSVAGPMRLERDVEPRRGRTAVVAASIELDEGTHPIVEASLQSLDVMSLLDGSKSLGDAVAASAARLALSDSQASQLRRDVLAVCRELLELGALLWH